MKNDVSIRDNEGLKEAYFDLEKSREKEIQSRLISDCLFTAITIISTNTDAQTLYEALFQHLKVSPGFDAADLFQVVDDQLLKDKMSLHYKNIYSTHSSLKFATGALPDFIKKKLGSKKAINIFDVSPFHDVYSMLDLDENAIKSFVLIPFRSNQSTYFVVLSSNERFFYTHFHNEMVSKLVPIFTQAMNQGEYLANMLHTSKLSALGEMASGIAHEINNPLAIIAFSMKYLRKLHEQGLSTSEKIMETYTDIEQTVARISRIVSGMRTVSRESLAIAPLILFDVFNDVLGLYTEKLKHASVDLEIDMNSPELREEIVSDRVQLSQVFINLIGNAYDAVNGMSDAWLKISFESQPDFISVKITDSGNGIPEDIKDKIFGPFFTTKPIGKGTGLGLSISKGIMEKLEGKIELNPLSLNTSFVISIPRSPKETIP